MRIPSCAPFPTELTIAIGVASPSAQGQDIIKTDMQAKIAPKLSPTTKLPNQKCKN